MAYAYDEFEDMEAEAEGREPSDFLAELGEIEGDVSDVLEEGELASMAGRSIEEFDADKAARREWDGALERSLEAARQTPERKTFPFDGASNVRYPLLTNAAMHWGARSYAALVRDDQVVKPKVFGADPDGMKAAQGERVAQFTNYQYQHQCDEWDPSTDKLCHMLPVIGKAYRKMVWDRARSRPVIDLVSARHVYVSNDSPSLDQAPRVTQVCTFFPYEIAQKIASKSWRPHEYTVDSADSQKPIEYLEQYRYEDLDRDGLPEPYVATIHRETSTIVRLEPAFDPQHVRVWESGAGDALVRDLPWIDYDFLPDPEGGFHALGFGHLLEPVSATVNALLNQIIDAGTRANAGGGFISNGLKLRAGTIRLKPGEFHQVNAPAGAVTGSIHEMTFNGPHPVQMQMLELMLGAAQELTSNKDVLNGDIGKQQLAEGTVLALIEQGMQVFSAGWKRMYRSERRAHRRLFGLNRDFLDPKVYQQLLDIPDADPRKDFDMRGFDVLPVSDPASVTDMQRLARANFLGQRVAAAPDLYNVVAVEKRILEAARIPNALELLAQGVSPAKMLQMEAGKADVADKRAGARLKEAQAAQKFQQAQGEAFDRGVRSGELAGVDPNAGDPGVLPGAGGDGGGTAGPLGTGDMGSAP